MVWSGLFPNEGGDYSELREALDRLKLSDSALSYEPEISQALGFGFRAGFLGLLHMDIVKERLEREFDLELIATAPNVEFHVIRGGETTVVHNPAEMPVPGTYDRVEEPIVFATVITPKEYLGAVLDLCQSRRGELVDTSFLTPERAEVHYMLPLAEIVFDFFDQLKSSTRGYASPRLRALGLSGVRRRPRRRAACTASPSTRSARSCTASKAYAYGKKMTERLRELIPRQLFDVAIQAAIGSKIIARETVKAKRKDVLAKCYGGDITRKRKLLEEQKKGKARLRKVGSRRRAAGGVHRGAARGRGGEEEVSGARGGRRNLRPRAVLPDALRLLRLQRLRRARPSGVAIRRGPAAGGRARRAGVGGRGGRERVPGRRHADHARGGGPEGAAGAIRDPCSP